MSPIPEKLAVTSRKTISVVVSYCCSITYQWIKHIKLYILIYLSVDRTKKVSDWLHTLWMLYTIHSIDTIRIFVFLSFIYAHLRVVIIIVSQNVMNRKTEIRIGHIFGTQRRIYKKIKTKKTTLMFHKICWNDNLLQHLLVAMLNSWIHSWET